MIDPIEGYLRTYILPINGEPTVISIGLDTFCDGSGIPLNRFANLKGKKVRLTIEQLGVDWQSVAQNPIVTEPKAAPTAPPKAPDAPPITAPAAIGKPK